MALAIVAGSATPSSAQAGSNGFALAAPSGITTLPSANVVFPESEHIFAGGAVAAAINQNCLICHSAGMVLTQPVMSPAQWKAEVEKMRTDYHAPVEPKDVDAIADYLAKLRLTASDSHYQQDAGRQGDAGHGAVIAAQGVASGAPACAACHAFNGTSDASGAFPRIAGQSSYYLASQLSDLASGIRSNAIMSPIAKALSATDAVDVAAYYAGVKAPPPPLAPPAPALVKRGEQLATTGDAGKQIPGCEDCHGPRGAGEPPAIPYLAGQYAHYIASQIGAWQHGYRKNSPTIMLEFANKLDNQDIEAIAAYYQQLPTATQSGASK